MTQLEEYLVDILDLTLDLRDIFRTELNKVRYRIVDDADTIKRYRGERTTIMMQDGRVFDYKTVDKWSNDGVMVLDAIGKKSLLPTPGAGQPAKQGQWVARYKGAADLSWWPVVGDNAASDSAAVQAAINYVLSGSDPTKGELPKYNENNGTLRVPKGTFRVQDIEINGSIELAGLGGGTYASSSFVQENENKVMFWLGPAQDGMSNSTVFERIAFKSGSATVDTSVAQIKTRPGISTNSVYFRKCWFKSPEFYAIWMTQADDLQIINCTFDVAAFHSIRLGTEVVQQTINNQLEPLDVAIRRTGRVTNAIIQGNTFYHVALNIIKMDNVQGVTVGNNKVYTNDDYLNGNKHEFATPNALFINGLSGHIKGLTVSNNELNNIPSFMLMDYTTFGLNVTGNVGVECGNYFLKVTGGGVLYHGAITGNVWGFRGAWTSPIIDAPSCGIQNYVFASNSFFSGQPTALGFNMPDPRVFNNKGFKTNALVGFTKENNLSDPAQNQGVPDEWFVQGSSWTRTEYSTAPDADTHSGLFNWLIPTGGLRGMIDSTRNVLGINIRHENGTGNGGFHSARIFKPLYGHAWYEESIFADTAGTGDETHTTGPNGPKRIHSDRSFLVDHAAVLAAPNGKILGKVGGIWKPVDSPAGGSGSGSSTVVANPDLDTYVSVAAARAVQVPATFFRLIVVMSDEENLDENGQPLPQTVYFKSQAVFKRIDTTRFTSNSN